MKILYYINVKISILVKQTISVGMNTKHLEITFITVNHISQQSSVSNR